MANLTRTAALAMQLDRSEFKGSCLALQDTCGDPAPPPPLDIDIIKKGGAAAADRTPWACLVSKPGKLKRPQKDLECAAPVPQKLKFTATSDSDSADEATAICGPEYFTYNENHTWSADLFCRRACAMSMPCRAARGCGATASVHWGSGQRALPRSPLFIARDRGGGIGNESCHPCQPLLTARAAPPPPRRPQFTVVGPNQFWHPDSRKHQSQNATA